MIAFERFAVGRSSMLRRVISFPVTWRSPLAWFSLVLGVLFLSSSPALAAEGLSMESFIDSPEKLPCLDGKITSCRDSLADIDGLLLPDLQTLPPFDFRLVEYRGGGRREIRFANSVWNSGEGVLELHGDYNPGTNAVVFNQHLFGEGQRQAVHRVGEFIFEPEHNHWHWEDFSIYEIWSLAPDGKLGEVVAASGKVGYCMLDIRRIEDEEIEEVAVDESQIPDTRQYRGCGTRLQGISVGWVDTYFNYTPGQVMDVTGLRDGIYALRSTVDPEGYLYEANEENNSVTVYFSMYGNEFRLIGETLSTSCGWEETTIPGRFLQNYTCK